MRLKSNSTDQKLRGAYYTPESLASLSVSLFCDQKYMRILEPSCGDGSFLGALAEHRYLEGDVQCDAVELDRDAVENAKEKYGSFESIDFINDDFFSFYETAKPESYDLIVGNPPYIRYQYLKPSERERLASVLTSQGMKANKLINAWVGFTVACTNLLMPGGKLVFVIPAEILQVVYAEDLRLFLSTHFREITLVSFEKLVFDEAEQEVVLFAGVKGDEESLIRTIQIEDIEAMRSIELGDFGYQLCQHTKEKWTNYFVSSEDAAYLSNLKIDSKMAKMADLALINVGITTGNNDFFSLTEETAKRYDLREFTLPLIGRSAHASGAFFRKQDWLDNLELGKKARLLVLKDGDYSTLSTRQRKYIDEGEQDGANSGYKCSIRNSWYSVPSVWVPDAFFLRRNNLFPKFVLNDCGAVSTDTMHRLKLNDDVDSKAMVVSYYNSIGFAFTELCGRSYGGGVLEILPKEVGSMLVPDPRQLALSSSECATVVARIDKTLRSDADIEELLDYVDNEILVKKMGLSPEVLAACRRIWKTLQRRRLARGEK